MATPLKRQGSASEHLAAIYVHAGAGYHSVQNEHVHLSACAAAAKAGMVCLNAGGSALDAVELAIKTLEDNEVTNAGYGSNLTVDGKVEGDATIVDHFGRSGAVGAIGRVQNPIHAARAVYEHAIQPMKLRRVPPNLLVGDGAADFASEHGISMYPNEVLVSSGAHQRFQQWQKEIQRVEEPDSTPLSTSNVQSAPCLRAEDEQIIRNFGPAGSQNPTIAALANESQPFTPTEFLDNRSGMIPGTSYRTNSNGPNTIRRRSVSRVSTNQRPVDSANRDFNLSGQQHPNTVSSFEEEWFKPRYTGPTFDPFRDYQLLEDFTTPFHIPTFGNPYDVNTASTDGTRPESARTVAEPAPRHPVPAISPTNFVGPARNGSNEDMISDTVGAIAVDVHGNIAAASSSGGIGMKHKGRVGPAALVGIGTAVIPLHPDDKEQTTVACVTSGTGEHMATSLAASTCAQRLWSSTKLDAKGVVVACDDEESMQSFIRRDFMGHPSVQHSTTGGAIGLLAVKKDVDGMWLYFAHNTDSFAIASMHARDLEPHTVMSRSNKQGRITTGGRSMRIDPFSLTQRAAGKTDARSTKRTRQSEGGYNG